MSANTRGGLRSLALGLALSLPGCLASFGPAASYQANEKLLSLAPSVVYQGSAGSLSYQTATGKDAQRLLPTQRVRGRACQRGIQVPIFALLATRWSRARGASGLSAGWGDGSYEAAVDDVRRQMPPGSILFDVRADLNQRSILSVYREQCVLIDAGVLVPVPPV